MAAKKSGLHAKPVRSRETKKGTISLTRALGDHKRKPIATGGAGMKASAQVKVRPEGGTFKKSPPAKVPARALKAPNPDRSFGKTSTAAQLKHFKSKASDPSSSPKRAASAQDSAKQMSQVAKHDRLRAGKASGAVQHSLQRGKKGGTFYVVNGKKVYAKK